MSRRLSICLAAVALLSMAAAVIALLSTPGLKGAERVKAAIRWPSNCAHLAVRHPSRAPVMRRWQPYTVQTADIVCPSAGRYVDYAQFRDIYARDQALAAGRPSQRLCLIDATAVIDNLADVGSAVFADMCRSLGGTFADQAG